MTIEHEIRAAARAMVDLNIFAAVVTILEGGHICTPQSHAAANKIIKICKSEQQKRLAEYDDAVREISAEFD